MKHIVRSERILDHDRAAPRLSRWQVPAVALVVVVLVGLSVNGLASASPATPPVAFSSYGLGNFSAPFHLAKTSVSSDNITFGCANSSTVGTPYFNPVTGRSVFTSYARAESCPGQPESLINNGFGAGPAFLVNSSLGRITVLLKETVRIETTWNFTSGTCVAASNGSSGVCRTSAYSFGYAEAGLEVAPTDAGVSYGVTKEFTVASAIDNATCSGGACVGWSTGPQSGFSEVTDYFTFNFSYDLSSLHRYLIWAAGSAYDYPILYGVGASLTGASVQQTTTDIWSVNSILIT
jgi:hypothetical protein